MKQLDILTYHIHSCSILSAEFIRASMRGADSMDVSVVTTISSTGKYEEVSLMLYMFFIFEELIY